MKKQGTADAKKRAANDVEKGETPRFLTVMASCYCLGRRKTT